MPALTGKQYRAMAAAKAGNSTLGIPMSVGSDFVNATPKKKRKSWASGPLTNYKSFKNK